MQNLFQKVLFRISSSAIGPYLDRRKGTDIILEDAEDISELIFRTHSHFYSSIPFLPLTEIREEGGDSCSLEIEVPIFA